MNTMIALGIESVLQELRERTEIPEVQQAAGTVVQQRPNIRRHQGVRLSRSPAVHT